MNFVSDAVNIYDDAKRIIAFIQDAEGAPPQWDLLRARLRISVDILENITGNYNHSAAEIQLRCERELFRVFGPDGSAPKYRAKVRKIGEKLPDLGKSKLQNFWHKYKWPFNADTIEKDVNDLKIWEEDFRELREAIANALAQDTNRQVDILTQRLSEEQLEELYGSLSSIVPWQKIRQDFKECSKSLPDWILREDRYRAFVDTDQPLMQELWGVGHFGVGKTMIASFVANHLIEKIESSPMETPTATVAVFYCNHKSMQEQSTDVIIRSLCRQVFEGENPSNRAIQLVQKYRKAQRARAANDITPTWLFQALIRGFKEVFVVIDALDESQAPLDLLTQLREISLATANLRIFITSRPDLGYFPAKIDDIQIRIVSKDEDMINFVHHGLKKFEDEQNQLRDSEKPLLDAISTPSRLDEITKTIVKSAKGKFLIAGLLLKSLQDCNGKEDFDSHLHGETIDIGDIFEDYISRIRTQPLASYQILGMKALMWVLHARRLLKAKEIFQILAMYDRDPSKRLDTSSNKNPALLSDYTCGLLNYDITDSTVSVHKGLQDAFEMPHQRHAYFQGAEAEMARICLEYLSLVKFSYDQCRGDRELNNWINANPFLGYAASQWGAHVKSSPEAVFLADDKPFDLIAFMKDQTYLACYSNAMHPALKQIGSVLKPNDMAVWAPSEEHEPLMSEVHVAVFFGLELVVETLLKGGAQVDDRSRGDFTPLHLACRLNSASLVELLLRFGADPGYRNLDNQSCLHTAATEGYSDIVRILLRERPRMIDRLNWFPNTPLNDALKSRNNDIAEDLIRRGANVEVETGAHRDYSALDWAAKFGVPSVIPEILQRDKRLKKHSDTWYRKMVPALYLSIEHHRNEVVKVLLDNDAPVAFTNHDPTYRTSLHIAALSGNAWAMDEILQRNPGAILQGYGLIIDLHTSRKETPLLLTIERRHLEAAKVLIRHGAKARPYPDGRTPLHQAAIHDVPGIVEPLLDHEPGLLNAVCAGHKTALLLAAEHGKEAVVDVLLRRGADPWISSDGGGTPLHWATSHARPGAVHILAQHALAKSIPKFLDVQNDKGKTALHEAAQFDRGRVAHTLLQSGVSMLVLSHGGGTALHWASERGNGIVDQLLNHASEQSIPLVDVLSEPHHKTALQVAVQHNREETVRKLLAAGASPVKHGSNGATALHWAASHNRFPIFKLMLSNVLEKLPPSCLDEAQNERGMVVLHEAAQFGRDEMIKELLDAGGSPLVANLRAATPFHWATSHGHPSTIRLLIKFASKHGKVGYLDYPNKDGMTALHEAVQHDRWEIANILLEAGASPLVRAPVAATPFHWAASKDRLPIFEQLISYASRLSSPGYLDFQNHYGKTALHEAAQFNRPNIAQRLLDEGASPTLQDHEGRSALHWAVVSENTRIIEMLVRKAGKSLFEQVTDFWQDTPLHTAVVLKKHAVLEKLLALGANPEVVTVQGRTALHLAMSPAHADAKSTKILLYFHAKAEARNMMGATVLHEAAHANSDALDAVLGKCDPTLVLATDDSGCTPLHIAAADGKLDLMKKLVQKCPEAKRRYLLRCRRKDGRMAKDLALYEGKRGAYDFLVEQEALVPVDEGESAVPVGQQQPSTPVPVEKPPLLMGRQESMVPAN